MGYAGCNHGYNWWLCCRILEAKMKKFEYTKVRFFEEQKVKQIKKSLFVSFLFFLLALVILSIAYISEELGQNFPNQIVGASLISLCLAVVVFLTIDIRRP